jgi:hypothetical protein
MCKCVHLDNLHLFFGIFEQFFIEIGAASGRLKLLKISVICYSRANQIMICNLRINLNFTIILVSVVFRDSDTIIQE